MTWQPVTEITLEEQIKPIYNHGFTPEEVIEITNKRNNLFDRIAKGHTTTLDEFKHIIVPYQRIYRTEQFILNPIKEKKVKEPKTPKEKKEKVPKEPKAPKVKKPTAKEMRERMEMIKKITMKQAAGLPLTETELNWLNKMKEEQNVA